MRMKKRLLTLTLLIASVCDYGQAWKSVHHEIYAGVGASNFLGDLGGAKGVGTQVVIPKF